MPTAKSSPESIALLERQSYLETFLPSELINSLPIKLPRVDERGTLSLHEICSAAYYGLNFFESDAKKLIKHVKKMIHTEHLQRELAEAKSELKAYLMWFISVSDDLLAGTEFYTQLESFLNEEQMRGFKERHQQYLDLLDMLSKGSTTRLNYLIKDFNLLLRDFDLSGSEKLEMLYKEFDINSRKLGFKSFRELAFTQQYLNRLQQKTNSVEISSEEIKLLKQHPAYMVDLYLQAKSADWPQYEIFVYNDGIQLLHKCDNVVEVFAPIFVYYNRSNRQRPLVGQVTVEEIEEEKDEIKQIVKTVFGPEIDIDMSKYHAALCRIYEPVKAGTL